MLVDVVWQACSYDGELDSMGISTYADALRLLARCGRVAVVLDAGKRVRARLVAEVDAPAWGDACAGLSGAPPFVRGRRYPVLSAEEASAQLVRVTGRLSAAGVEYGEPVTGLYLRSGRMRSGRMCSGDVRVCEEGEIGE